MANNVQAILGVINVAVGIIGAVGNWPAPLQFAWQLLVAVLWVLALIFDMWGWYWHRSAVMWGVIGMVGVGILLTASANKALVLGLVMPLWLLIVGFLLLFAWGVVELLTNLRHGRYGQPVRRYLDGRSSIAVALALIVATVFWFSMTLPFPAPINPAAGGPPVAPG